MTYKNGYFFTDPLQANLQAQMTRIRDDKSSLIIVDGGLGEGKTTLGKHIGNFCNGSKIDLTKQYAIGGFQFQERLSDCYTNKLHVLVYDEGGDFSRRGALTQFNQQLNRTFETYRAFHVMVILCVPCFAAIDISIFINRIPRMLINCYNRTQTDGDFRVYDLSAMFWLKHHMDKIVVKPQAYNSVYPNFYGHFLNLPESERIELEQISTSGKEKINTKAMIDNLGLADVRDIAVILNRSVQWVRLKITQHKWKPYKVIKGKNYYHKEKIGQLIS